jgi:hypothetical protein
MGAAAINKGADASSLAAAAVTFGAVSVTIGAAAVTAGATVITIGAASVTVGAAVVTIGAAEVTIGAAAVTTSAQGSIQEQGRSGQQRWAVIPKAAAVNHNLILTQTVGFFTILIVSFTF